MDRIFNFEILGHEQIALAIFGLSVLALQVGHLFSS